jgi:PAS domain S-box-containing protein
MENPFELLEQLPVPMFFKARDGRYLGVNKAWEELFGVKRAAFLGKQVADLYPQNPEIARLHAMKDRELWDNPGSQSYEIPIVTPDGRRRDTVYYKATFPGTSSARTGSCRRRARPRCCRCCSRAAPTRASCPRRVTPTSARSPRTRATAAVT